MDQEKIRLSIPGVPMAAVPDADVQHLLDIRPISSHRIQQAARGEAVAETATEGPGDALVKIEYESGLTEWLRLDQFRDELSRGERRGAGSGERVEVPPAWNRGAGASRGPTDWVLKALHLFHVSPADALAEASADLVVRKLEDRLQTGLFRMRPDGTFGDAVASGSLAGGDGRPWLVFVHGTASSTQGSFSGFWRDSSAPNPAAAAATREWQVMLQIYGDRILALEHRTMSVSPAQNALDLVNLLPADANLHVISHSRGGLVGELLGLRSLSDADLRRFDGRPDQPLLKGLQEQLNRKNLHVTKFVRTACPAAGTILASKRIDLYLNIILNVIGLIPGLSGNPAYAIFKAAALEMIKLRADPAKIPGLEAQMPESPFIHLLNTRGRSSDADLGVIAGDFEGSGVWGTLKTYALRAYYLEDNDFVVNTRSMSGGMERKKGVWRFFDQGDTVNHFNYFKNARTRTQMLKWLASPAADLAPDFTRVRGIEQRGETRGATRGSENTPVAFLIPDAFGTHLADANGVNVWLDYDALSNGRFRELAGSGLKAGLVSDRYRALYDALSVSHDVVLVGYDWRQPVTESAAALERAVNEKLAGAEREVRFIGHGMGGLVAREYARLDPQRWVKLCGKGGGLLQLGTPTRGSWHAARLLAGRSRLVRMLALLGMHTDAEVAATLQSFAGLIDLLPEEMLDASRWSAEPLGRPAATALQEARGRRQEARGFSVPGRVVYVAGSASATPSGMDQFTAAGDGQVADAVGLPEEGAIWFHSSADHGGLLTQATALLPLLNTGTSGALDARRSVSSAALDNTELVEREKAVFFPSEAELTDSALGFGERAASEPEAAIRIRVVHGHLREARHPVTIGHYEADGIVSAEQQLDMALGGRLSTRFQMELYPGRVGSAEVVRAPGANPPGALIAGLGEVGAVTPERVRRGVLEGVLKYALTLAEDPGGQPGFRSAAISSVLIGVSGGRAISIADSVTSIVRACVDANRMLRLRNLWDAVRVDEIEFVECYEQPAIEAAHAAAGLATNLKNHLLPSERIEFEGQLRTAPGRRFSQPANPYRTGWWRRIQIAQDECRREGTGDGSTSLVFENLTDRARAEETVAGSQTALVDSLLQEATKRSSYDEEGAGSLFELLVPNSLKDQSNEQANLVLVLDPVAARYPWEVMAMRTRDKVEPLAVRMGMIRQLKLDKFRELPRGARDANALVIGDTETDPTLNLPVLPGAEAEARAVGELLNERQYAAEVLVRKPPLGIIRKLFAKDYRILHLAGHGIYNEKDPARSGMVLGAGIFLTPFEIRQIRNVPELVFINCCYLGTTDRPHRMAASIAQELIAMGVKAVVAAGWAVNDAAALVFAQSFYRNLLAGMKFGESVKRAREDTHALADNNTWGAYQCYGNPDFMLASKGDGGAWSSRDFYSRRECLDELRDVVASAGGAAAKEREVLAARAARMDRLLIPSWRDGESLFALAESYKSLRDFEAAIAAYEEALRDERAGAPVQAIEQMANVKDRLAKSVFGKDRERAEQLWNEAAQALTRLNELLGNSGERLALLGAIYKRRGDAGGGDRTELFAKASDAYRKAYDHTKESQGKVDLFSGLNAVALGYLAKAPSGIEAECFREAAKHVDNPDFWTRVYRPDAKLLQHLIQKDLEGSLDEVIREYRAVMNFGTAGEQDSVIGQLRFLKAMTAEEKDAELLGKIIDTLTM